MIRVLLGLLLFVPSAASAQSAGPEALRSGAALMAPALPRAGAALGQAPLPSWLAVEGEGERFLQAKKKLLEAMALIGTSETGRLLGKTLTEGKGRVKLVGDHSFHVVDGENTVYAGLEFILERDPAVLAPLLAHELDHLRQGQSGLVGMKARGVREIGSVLVQSRVWVEIGSPIAEKDWTRNGSNSQDMWAWLAYPRSTIAAVALRADLEFDLSDAALRRYWETTLAEEKAWRAQAKLPEGRDSHAAALFILRQASTFSTDRSGAVSPWLPEFLERAAALGPGATIVPPAPPSTKDREFMKAGPPIAGFAS